MHKGAAACFLLAMFFYSFAWTAVASGLAIFGVIFEIAAWVIWLSANDGT